MLPVVGWKIYRADGSVYASSGAVAEVPDGIQVVIWYHEAPYRTLDYGLDTYNVDGRTLNGVYMGNEEYAALVDRALADMEWPA